jgi:hypothetical protein
VTVIERDAPEERIFARVSALDEEAEFVGLVGEAMHSFSRFDVGGAEFSVEENRLVVSRNDLEWLIFEVAD